MTLAVGAPEEVQLTGMQVSPLLASDMAFLGRAGAHSGVG